MRSTLLALYRECSAIPSPAPDLSQALANAASVLGSVGTPSALVREAVSHLEAARNNSLLGAN